MSFDDSFAHVLAWEGGLKLAHNPTEDFRTFAGINEKAHPEWPGWKEIDSDKHLTHPNDLAVLVKEFYRALYDQMKAAASGVDRDYFDTAVLQGERKARATLARMQSLLSPNDLLPIEELNLRKPKDVRVGVYRAIRQADLIALTEAHPKFEIYLWGWLRRARGDKP